MVKSLSDATAAWDEHTIFDPKIRAIYKEAQLKEKRKEWAAIQSQGRSDRSVELAQEIRGHLASLREHIRGVLDPLQDRPTEEAQP